MRMLLAQLDPVVGNIAGNLAKLAKTLTEAQGLAPDLVVLPELYLVGYPPKDLLERGWFLDQVVQAIDAIRRLSLDYPQTGILFGAPVCTGDAIGRGLFNAALLVHRGQVLGQAHKVLLPTYDVFDEARYFDPAASVRTIAFKGECLGVHICEDAWTDTTLWAKRPLYDMDPVAELVAQGATLLVNLSASPFSAGKERLRFELIAAHARRYHVPFAYVNQVGGNDELVFDGRSLCLDDQGRTIAVLPAFQEAVQLVDTSAAGCDGYQAEEEIATVYQAIVLGLRDYMRKCGFGKAVIGLSGGIDSAVTCALAVAALGQENVLGVSMPSEFSSRGSVEDSRQLAANLGIAFQVVPIQKTFHAYLEMMQPAFAGTRANEAEENLQARIRGNVLMALSNKFGYLVLSTGNKTELAVGYCTLYGDMSGGLAVISDVPKMMVYDLAHYINRAREIVPLASIEKPPSAELKPDQVDQDTLPPYPVLDAILHLYVEEACSIAQITALGYDAEVVRWVARTVDRNEYKRKQAAPGLRVTTKAFGVGRRMPIAARVSHAPLVVPDSPVCRD
jgi:NAD+ synthase (glutamine-hydrolysing)